MYYVFLKNMVLLEYSSLNILLESKQKLLRISKIVKALHIYKIDITSSDKFFKGHLQRSSLRHSFKSLMITFN